MEYEYQNYGQGNPFEINNNNSFEDHFYQNQKCPYIPVQIRLKENKQRRLIIQKEKQKQKQFILQKRREKEDNVQRILKQKQEARQNAKILFGAMQKTFTNKFEEFEIKKAEDIQEKIQQCRSRADKYRTMYKKKIHEDREDRERSVRERKRKKQKLQKQRSVNFHLAQWKNYEKKIAQKYKGEEKNPTRMYESLLKKQQQLKQIIERHKKEQSGQQRLSIPVEPQQNFKRILIKKNRSQKNISQSRETSQKSNPVFSMPFISAFGLSKSIRNPQKMMRQMKAFITENLMVSQPTQDDELIRKFEQYLQKDFQHA